jgi:hypothetical protein
MPLLGFLHWEPKIANELKGVVAFLRWPDLLKRELGRWQNTWLAVENRLQ